MDPGSQAALAISALILGGHLAVKAWKTWRSQKRINWMYRANPKKLETQLFIIERNPESQLFHDVGPSAKFVDKIPNVSDSIKTTIDGWNVTTLRRVCCEHH